MHSGTGRHPQRFDGDGTPGFHISLTGGIALVAADFVL
jgi:hypothetical protein